MQSKLESYIRKIRNADKRDYAIRYANWKLSGETTEEPSRAGLSVMGAQAVRMNVDAVIADSQEQY